MKLNHQITDLLQRIGAGLGVHVSRAANTLPLKRQRFLSDLGIDVVLDIGANVGHYAGELRRHGYGARIVSFEPIAQVFAELQSQMSADQYWKGLQLALGERDGSTQINVSHNLVSSSLLQVTPSSVQAAGQTAIRTAETITVARLDSLRAQIMKPGERVYMKIDVQGFERQVLQGAPSSLEQVLAMEIELSLVELYAGQTLMPEMCSLISQLGFRPAWLERGFKDPRTGYLLQMDGVFVRNDLAGEAIRPAAQTSGMQTDLAT